MEWNTRTEEVLQTWRDTQRKTWEGWLDAVQGVDASRSTEMWHHTVELWREAVSHALKTQLTWTLFWTDCLSRGTGNSNPFTGWVQQMGDLMKGWNETQLQLSDYWFDTMEKANPTRLLSPWDSATAKQLVQDWQNAGYKMLEVQMNWLRIWAAVPALASEVSAPSSDQRQLQEEPEPALEKERGG